ncbi:MAG: S8/S53 family peptidase [Gammaproteobacteria bacterium]|nr:S8/S53 family peptidase [Gammaproteobacteria bacterium]
MTTQPLFRANELADYYEVQALPAHGVNFILIDTPIDLQHPAFSGAQITQYNFVTGLGGHWPASMPVLGPHGTAVAGLLVGQTFSIELSAEEAKRNQMDVNSAVSAMLPATGLAPGAALHSLALSFDIDPKRHLAALDQALALAERLANAIVLIPRGLDAFTDEPFERARALTDRLRQLAKRCPVLCAAGNTGSPANGEPAYPANIDWGQASREDLLFAVGAVNEHGIPCAYSAPCHWAERSDDAISPTQALDYQSENAATLHAEYGDYLPEVSKTVSKRTHLSTDLVGCWGYRPADSDIAHLSRDAQMRQDLRALYCRFGGTSAATAVAAARMGHLLVEGTFDQPMRREQVLQVMTR